MIKKYRELKKYTQEELAELIGISTRQLQRLEKYESEPKISTLKKIIEILKIENKDIIEYIKRK